MGDIKRIHDHFDSLWSMFVGFYDVEEKDGVKCICIKQVKLLKLRPHNKKIFFGERADIGTVIEELSRYV